MLNNKIKHLFILTLFFALSACTSDSSVQGQQSPPKPSQTGLKLEILHQSSQCGSLLDPQWVSKQESLEELLLSIQRMLIPPSSQPMPTVDFTHYRVLVLPMGQQRTGGYAVRLSDEELHIASGIAQVNVRWQEPDPGMMVTQVITNPCIFIKVPRGEYQIVRAVDQDNKVRTEFSPD